MFFKKISLFVFLIILLFTTLSAKNYDFNGDGKSDILWRTSDGNCLWNMESNGKHIYKNIGGKNLKYALKGMGDFNGDGITDILWKTKHYYALWYMNADGTHQYKYIGRKSTSYSVKAVADFNGDGIADILWRRGSGNYLWYMKSDGTHRYRKISSKSTAYSIVGVGDFNSDGMADILWRRGAGNYLWYMKSDGTHQYKNIGSKSTEYTVMGVADFNNDGIVDILWKRASGHYLWYMKSDGKHQYKNIGSKSVKKYLLEAIGDFNGDGHADILWKNGRYYSLWYMKSDGKHQYKYIGSKSENYRISNKIDITEHATIYEDAEVTLSSKWVQVLGHYKPVRVAMGFHSDGTLVLTPEWVDGRQNVAEYHLEMNNSKEKILEMDMGGLSSYRLPNLPDKGYIPHYQVGVYVQTTNGRRAMIWDSFFNHGDVKPFSDDYGDGNIWLSYPSPVEHVRGYEDVGLAINIWNHFRVDVEAELQKLEPNNKVIKIETFLATGGFIDNLKLSSY